MTGSMRDSLIGELGDCFWYMTELCGALNVSPSYVLEENLSKLKKRHEDGKIKGEGDKR
jgi:NTP pyrophosphatase (non-canonical NTP hydrolase)